MSDKSTFLIEYAKKNSVSLKEIIYMGNDLNDLAPMIMCGYSVAPKDSHPLIMKYAKYVIPRNGGDGCIRFFIEQFLGFEKMGLEDMLKLV